MLWTMFIGKRMNDDMERKNKNLIKETKVFKPLITLIKIMYVRLVCSSYFDLEN
jgi:hypothetical protein